MQRPDRKAKYGFWGYLLLGICVLCTGLILVSRINSRCSPQGQYLQIQNRFLENEKRLNEAFDALIAADSICSTVDLVNFCQEQQLDMQQLAFFVYQDSLLIGWSSNLISLPNTLLPYDTAEFMSIDNKWLYIKRINKGNRQYIGSIIIANNFDDFPHFVEEQLSYIPLHKSLVSTCEKIVYNNLHDPVFKVCIHGNMNIKTSAMLLRIILILTGWMLLAIALSRFLLFKKFFYRKQTLIFVIASVFIFVTTKLSLLLFNDSSSDLFSPIYYASHFDSLGKLFVHVFAIFLSAAFFMRFASLKAFYTLNAKSKIFICAVSILLAFCVLAWIYRLVYGITNDSIVVLKPELIYQYDILSIVAILSIVMLLWSGCFVLYKLLAEIFTMLRQKGLFLGIVGGGLGIFVVAATVLTNVFSHSVGIYGQYLLLPVFVLLVGVTAIFIYKRKKWYNLLFQCLLLIILSFTVWLTARKSVKEREEKYMETMAKDIFSMEDAFLSDEFCDLAEKLEKDSALADLFARMPLETIDIQQFIVSEYLSPYSGKYNIRVYAGLESIPEDELRLEKILKNISPDAQKNTTSMFFFNHVGFGRSEYILNLFIPIHRFTDMGRLIVIFSKDAYNQQQSGLGKLLRKEMSYFSYAGYENGILESTSNLPSVSYRRLLADYALDTIYSGMKFTSDDMNHTLFAYGQKTLIISAGNDIVWMQLSFIAGLFLIQFVFLILVGFFLSPFSHVSFWSLDFKESIQLYMAILILLSTFITGVLFFNFFNQIHEKEHFDSINQSLERVRKAISVSMAENDSICASDRNMFEEIEDVLNRFYGSDLPDINIYNPSGMVVKSLGKGIFTAQRIHPLAYRCLLSNRHDIAVFDEKFDLRSYKSYYKNILNSKGETIGFINHVYFKNRIQRPFDRHHIQFLSQFMSISILILIAIVAASMLLVKRLTIPLHKVIRYLSEFNSNPRIMKDMKKIEWNHHDEFGELVKTYNLLIERIVVSAQLMERTAQEMTWKDMAKQVAHEIKNPLTPIRLTTQQILREINTRQIDKEKIAHYLSMIIEQTDVLNEIATSFSVFAKINLQNGNPEDLLSIIENTIDSYLEGDNEIFIVTRNRTLQSQALCYTNRVQITQVLNNLIKNAIQAAKPHQRQDICISLHHYGDKMWQIQISDTGTGMTNELKEKIFSPDFTTKSAGTGLGLALVKSIVGSWGGSVYFESTLGIGTTFFINLPKYVPQNE
ncbi:MAG: HAMP domain-containing histidine kinase [Bacteroidales bacterium]|jgi:signal transduction histidine kinase|nr:HAMP domain-containing histidine kinase [Bacteroidales bacterium]